MTRAEVADQLRSFLQTKSPTGKPLTDTTHLRDEWRLSSLSILETVSFVEDTFDVRMNQTDINVVTFATVVSLADFVLSRMK
jgi:acyl carrier protein